MQPSSNQTAEYLSPTFHCFKGAMVLFFWLLFFLAGYLLGVPFGLSEASEMSPFFRVCLNEASVLSQDFITAVSSNMLESPLCLLLYWSSNESSYYGRLSPSPPGIFVCLFTCLFFKFYILLVCSKQKFYVFINFIIISFFIIFSSLFYHFVLFSLNFACSIYTVMNWMLNFLFSIKSISLSILPWNIFVYDSQFLMYYFS